MKDVLSLSVGDIVEILCKNKNLKAKINILEDSNESALSSLEYYRGSSNDAELHSLRVENQALKANINYGLCEQLKVSNKFLRGELLIEKSNSKNLINKLNKKTRECKELSSRLNSELGFYKRITKWWSR